MQSTLARAVRNPYLTIVSRLVLGAILLLSGLAKLGVPRAMMNSIDAYDIALPRWLVGAMSNA
ncbi:MAG: hypothetical protein M3014_01450, partial [Chloroflexota bacterium]|nr:hypothetical protein [Chloroflexota bacterium]